MSHASVILNRYNGVLHNIRIATERTSFQHDKTLLFYTEVSFNLYREILFSELLSNYAYLNKV